MDADREENRRLKPDQLRLLKIVIWIIAILVYTGFGYLLLDPLLTMTHTSFTSFLLQPLGIAFVFVWIIGAVSLPWVISQYAEWWANPLTTEEENDPLIREVILTGSFDAVFDLCLKAPYAAGRWWLVLPDRPKMSVSAWWTGIVLHHIRISLQKLAEDRYRVVLTGSRYMQWYEKTGSPTTWEQYPHHALARDMHRLQCIRSLDKILGFLLAEGGKRS